MNKAINISVFLIIFGCLSTYCFGQNPATTKQANKTKAIYVPVKTKMDIAIEREQKKELERVKVLELQNEQASPYERISLENKANVEMLYETPVKLEKQMLIKAYKSEVKEEQEQHLKKEELQKPENKK